MSSRDWHKYNNHLKSLVTEDYLTIEYKEFEPKVLKDYAGFIVLSNHDAPLRVEMSDWCIVTENPIYSNLYQNYFTWCENNCEKSLTTKVAGKHFKSINIEKKQVRINGKREWVYVLDRFKIIVKLCGLIGDIEEFSNSPQANLDIDIFTDIPIFDIPEKKISESSNANRIEKGKDSLPALIAKMTQNLFDSITDESSVASSSKSTVISTIPEIEHVESLDDKPKSSEIIEPRNDEPKISPNLPANDESKSSNEESIIQPETAHSSLPTRAERETRLRKCTVKYGQDPDKFMIITEKDRNLVRIFRNKMMSDAEMNDFARKNGDDPEEYMELTRREKLICIEIKLRMHEDNGKPQADAYDDEEWKKNIVILQENVRFCKNPARGEYCASHAFKIRKGLTVSQPCKGCGRGTKSNIQLCVPCGQAINLLTKREINLNGSTSRKLIHNGFRYVNNLAEFLQLPDAIDYYFTEQMDYLKALSYPAIIPPIDIMQNRPDIYKRWFISIETYQSLFQAL
ncbi:hypothetical protein Glove_137g85 [Diversispora epigaea]|uniref:NrS-1 polymerase-like helicase domain-containing protein n=1 Tax=Diversispora epigaea TaxID=1348612 RepID=A0A397IYW1_9GLOM|nr:hypothetical protein Glove_137g85 [Diversispora epigaea]